MPFNNYKLSSTSSNAVMSQIHVSHADI